MADHSAAAAPRRIRLIHLTDIHAVAPDAPHRGPRADGLARLRVALARIEELTPGPDAVIVSGDLTDIGDPASYAALKEAIASVDAPLLLALGNHDKRPAFRASGLDPAASVAAPDAPYVHDRLIGDAHVIVLDSSVPGQIGGALGEDQLAFLDAALARHSETPKLLVVHHPPASDILPGPGWARLDATSSARLGDAIAGRRVAAILSGHIHVDRLAMWRGVPVVTAAGLYTAMDPLGPPSVLRIIDGGSFGLCALAGDAFSASFVTIPASGAELARVPLP